jgi:hypothetical protein
MATIPPLVCDPRLTRIVDRDREHAFQEARRAAYQVRGTFCRFTPSNTLMLTCGFALSNALPRPTLCPVQRFALSNALPCPTP